MRQNNVARAVALLGSIPAPASVTDSAGALIFANRAMRALMRVRVGAFFKCRWLNSRGGSGCPDCAETPTLEGRCFFAREDRFRLAAAVRILDGGGALARIYCAMEAENTSQMHEAVGRLLALGPPMVSHGATPFPHGHDGSLRAVVSAAIAECGLADQAENQVAPAAGLQGADPTVLRCATAGVLRHLLRAGAEDRFIIRDFSGVLSGQSALRPGLSFHMLNPAGEGKAHKSRLGALGFGLRNYFHILRQATGRRFAPPEVFQEGAHAQVRLYISDEKAVAGPDTRYAGRLSGLSAREREILEMIRMGHDNKSISEILSISESTVRQHLKSLYRKAGVKNRLALIFESWNET